MSLLTISISVTAAAISDQTLYMKAGEAANFQGFLVPEWQFRKMNQELIERDLLKKRIDEQTLSKKETSEGEYFLWGLATGALSVLIAEKIGGSK